MFGIDVVVFVGLGNGVCVGVSDGMRVVVFISVVMINCMNMFCCKLFGVFEVVVEVEGGLWLVGYG